MSGREMLKEPEESEAGMLDDSATPLPKQRGKYAWNDFSAPPLPRSAAVATDTEWEKATRANWQRMIAELGKEARSNPAVLELVAAVFGFASRQEAIDEGLTAGLASDPAGVPSRNP